jgi:hypothetical protein
MTRRLRFADVLPAPSPAIVIAAVIAGAVFASIGLQVDRGVTLPRAVAITESEPLQQEQQRTTELLRKIEIEVAAPSRASLRAPVVTVRSPRSAPVIASRPRVTPRRNTVSAGIWSATAERQRQLRRDWIDRELSRRASD